MKLTSLSTAELRKELAKREKQIPLLTAKKAKLIKRIEKIDALIAEMEGQARKPYTKKAGKVKVLKAVKPVKALKAGKIGTLPDVLFDAMKDKGAVKVGEAARLAKEAGYQSKSGLFVMIVGKALKGDKRFKKVERGLFQVR